MHLIRIDHVKSARIIESVTAPLPIGSSLGRICAVSPDAILAMDDAGQLAVYGISDGATWRVQELAGGIFERTVWRDGSEVSRSIISDALQRGSSGTRPS